MQKGSSTISALFFYRTVFIGTSKLEFEMKWLAKCQSEVPLMAPCLLETERKTVDEFKLFKETVALPAGSLLFLLASDEWLIRFIEPGSFGSCSRSLTSQGRVSRVGQRSVADSLRSIRFPTSHDRVSHAKVLKTNNLADVPTDRWFLFQCDQDGPTTVGFKVECRRATDVEYGTEFGRLRVEWTAAPVDLHA